MKKNSCRFTLLDGLVIIILLLIIVVVVKKITLNQYLQMPEQKIVLTFSLENERDFVGDSLSIGDPVFQKGALEPFGTILQVETRPAEEVVTDSNGAMFLGEVPDRFDTFITVETTGFVSRYGGSVIDNSFFYLNQYLSVRTNKVNFAVRVIEVR